MSANNDTRATQSYGTIVIVGGGCYGTYYLTQLRRARAAGAIAFERLVVVDRDPACQAAARLAASSDPAIEVIISEWTPFFDDYFAAASIESSDAIVPSPLMPHLMYEWIVRRAHARWPGRSMATRALPYAPDVPWHYESPDGTEYVSYATWLCPINCIEPRRCPHTRGERTWTMPQAARAIVARATIEGEGAHVAPPLHGPVIFHCTHRAYGVGMFDTREVLAGDALVASVAATVEADVVVGTVSHCHGALNLLHIDAPA